MGKFEKHLGKGEEVEIDGEMFLLKPLDTESLPMFFKAMKAFSGASEGASIGETLANIDDEGLAAIKYLIERTLENSFPEESPEERKQFGLKYMVTLIGTIFEINMEKGSIETTKKQRIMDKIKERKDGTTAIKKPSVQ